MNKDKYTHYSLISQLVGESDNINITVDDLLRYALPAGADYSREDTIHPERLAASLEMVQDIKIMLQSAFFVVEELEKDIYSREIVHRQLKDIFTRGGGIQ